MPTRSKLAHHTSALLDSLHREFGAEIDHHYIDELGQSHFQRLMNGARILDYIPVLVYSATRNELLAIHEERLHRAA